MTQLLIGIALALFSVVGTAQADWQYTKWGMTVSQAQAASQGQLKPCTQQDGKGQTTEKSTALLYGPYRSGEFSFTSFLFFNKSSNKLDHVSLKLIDSLKSNELIGAVRSRYGEPSSHSKSALMDVWMWHEKTDQVSILVIGNGATATAELMYQPRITSSNRGL